MTALEELREAILTIAHHAAPLTQYGTRALRELEERIKQNSHWPNSHPTDSKRSVLPGDIHST